LVSSDGLCWEKQEIGAKIHSAIIININNAVAKLKMQNNKVKLLNVNKLKHFFPGDDTNLESENVKDADAATEDLNLIKFDPTM